MAGLALLAAANPGAWANTLVTPGPQVGIAKSTLSAAPAGEWNRLRYSGGKNVELWTLDGDALNKVAFYGGIVRGQPLMRELDRKQHPLPKVSATMLMTDIPTMLESSYRIQNGVTQMSIDGQEPATLSGHKAIRFTYSFTRDSDEVRRRGEGLGALVDGRLYLITYEAPALHYFDKDLARYRQLAETIRL